MIPHTALSSAWARLEPFAAQHVAPLMACADDAELWRWWPRAMATPEERAAGFAWLLDEQAAGRWLAWTVRDAAGVIVGQSCCLALRPEHAGLEIGGTWYVRGAQGGATNPAAKLLLLDHAFANGVERVEFKTHSRNARSRAALVKLGATFEGVFRRHIRLADGSWRDSAYYSIIAPEWSAVREAVVARLGG